MASTRPQRQTRRAALILCMPITRKVATRKHRTSDGENGERTYTSFMHKARWFVISQTVGDEFTPPRLPEWEAERALAALDIEQIAFTDTDGNCQGYAKKRQIAINPVAQLPHKTLFHEAAHVILGHTAEADFTDTERTPKNLREVEAEAVALLCCEALEPRRRGLLPRVHPELALWPRRATTPRPFPKRAPRRFSAPLIKSCEPDDCSQSKTKNRNSEQQRRG